MKRRCQNPNDSRYRRYGGKGIKVCNDWQTFIPFRDWALTNGYIEGLSIDRIDSNSNYEPQNCRWLTRAENSSRSTAKPVKCLETGEMFPSGAEAARTLGLSVHAVSYAIRRHGTAGDFHWQYDVSRFNEAKKAELNDRVKHDFNQRKQGSVTK